MDVKLGETRFFDFVTADPATGFPAAIFSAVIDVHAGGSSSPLAYSPVLNTRAGTGHYAATVAITTANGFAVDTNYAVSVTVTFTDGGQEYEIPLGNFMVREFSIDDIAADIAALSGSSITPTTNFNDESEELNLKRTDDYTSNTDQVITFNAVGFLEFPADSVYFRASRNGVLLFDPILCTTAVIDPDTQSVTMELTRDELVLLNYGAVDDYRYRCTYVEDSNPDPDIDDGEYRTIRWGKINVEKVGA